jgi:hypothetical protein
VVHTRPPEAVDPLHVERAPLRPGGHEHRAGDHVLAVVEVDAHHPLGAVHDLDRAVEARQDGIEALRL